MSTPLQKALKKSKACRAKEMHRVFSLIVIECFIDDRRMPIFLQKHPDMKEIFSPFTEGLNDQIIC